MQRLWLFHVNSGMNKWKLYLYVPCFCFRITQVNLKSKVNYGLATIYYLGFSWFLSFVTLMTPYTLLTPFFTFNCNSFICKRILETVIKRKFSPVLKPPQKYTHLRESIWQNGPKVDKFRTFHSCLKCLKQCRWRNSPLSMLCTQGCFNQINTFNKRKLIHKWTTLNS